MRNVELKVELRDPSLVAPICRRLGAIRVGRVEQTDTYFRIPEGKLLRRESTDEPIEWIFSHRNDSPPGTAGTAGSPRSLGGLCPNGPKTSVFTIYSESQARERFGQAPLPEWITVRKSRELWIRGNVRIHIDNVEGLGKFVEIEALVTPRRGVEICETDVLKMRDAFGPIIGESIGVGYSDMVAADAA